MNVWRVASATFVLALIGAASPRAANAAEETPEPRPPVLMAIDFDAIPSGMLPSVPREANAPPSGPGQQPPNGVRLQKIRKTAGKKKLPPGRIAKMRKTELVELAPDHPEIAAMYAPADEGTEFGGESVSRMACRRKGPPSPVRWETLTIGSNGNAQLEVKDLWFFSESCTVGLGSTSRVALKAIAWESGHPWLYAMRDDKTVTFVMPRANDVSAEAMVGKPLTVRGGFTRVSLPIGRWGASSFVAHLSSLELSAPPQQASPRGKGHDVDAPVEEATGDGPVEVAVELVQTMAERSPTLLVRREQPERDGRPVAMTE